MPRDLTTPTTRIEWIASFLWQPARELDDLFAASVLDGLDGIGRRGLNAGDLEWLREIEQTARTEQQRGWAREVAEALCERMGDL